MNAFTKEQADKIAGGIAMKVSHDPAAQSTNRDDRDRRKVMALESIALELNLLRQMKQATNGDHGG